MLAHRTRHRNHNLHLGYYLHVYRIRLLAIPKDLLPRPACLSDIVSVSLP